MWKKFKNWSNANSGWITVFAGIISIIGIIPFNKLDLGLTSSIFEKIKIVLVYQLRIPLYLCVIIILLTTLFIFKIIQRYKPQKILLNFMVGKWMNEWTVNGSTGREILKIDKEGKYFIDGEHWFTLKDFKYDILENKISFIKSGVKENDNRRMSNYLDVKNNDLLIGTENNYSIKYTRVE